MSGTYERREIVISDPEWTDLKEPLDPWTSEDKYSAENQRIVSWMGRFEPPNDKRKEKPALATHRLDIQTQIGTTRQIPRRFYFDRQTYLRAEKHIKKNQPLPEWLLSEHIARASREEIRKQIDARSPYAGGLSLNSPEALWRRILIDKNLLMEKGLAPSRAVLSSLGHDRAMALQRSFHHNWAVVAIFEYCRNIFSRDSREYIAAHLGYLQAAEAHFEAGFVYRDLLLLLGRSEAELENRKGGSRRGGEQAGNLFQKEASVRRRQLATKFAALARQSGGIWSAKEKNVLIATAAELCREADPELWTRSGAPLSTRKIREYIVDVENGVEGEEHKALITKALDR